MQQTPGPHACAEWPAWTLGRGSEGRQWNAPDTAPDAGLSLLLLLSHPAFLRRAAYIAVCCTATNLLANLLLNGQRELELRDHHPAVSRDGFGCVSRNDSKKLISSDGEADERSQGPGHSSCATCKGSLGWDSSLAGGCAAGAKAGVVAILKGWTCRSRLAGLLFRPLRLSQWLEAMEARVYHVASNMRLGTAVCILVLFYSSAM
jgi:hypothetical protein